LIRQLAARVNVVIDNSNQREILDVPSLDSLLKNFEGYVQSIE